MLPAWTEKEIMSHYSSDPGLHQMISWIKLNTRPDACLKGVIFPFGEKKASDFEGWSSVSYTCMGDMDIPGGWVCRHCHPVLPQSVWSKVWWTHGGSKNTRCAPGFTGQVKGKNVEMWCRELIHIRHLLWKPELEFSLVQRPLQRVAMDILGPFPETTIS